MLTQNSTKKFIELIRPYCENSGLEYKLPNPVETLKADISASADNSASKEVTNVA